MLDKIDLSKKMDKKEAKVHLEELEPKLALLQRQLREQNIPVMIVFEGFGGSGKGKLINRLIQPLDPRGFEVLTTGAETEDEKMHPFLWRFWNKTPAKGRLAIFDRCWYRKVLIERYESQTSAEEVNADFEDINSFEKQLTDDGTVIIKLFLAISKKEQKRRFEKLLENDETRWRVTKGDIDRNKNFEEFALMNDEMLLRTDTDYAPWTVVEADNEEFAAVKVFDTVVQAFSEALKKKELAVKPMIDGKFEGNELNGTVLKKIDLSCDISPEDYKKKLDKLQKRLSVLHSKLYEERIPVVLAFEGWDAGGKGGAIKRLTRALDPRGYRVNPTSSPNDIERAHHYLWRFWTKMPKDGHIAIFDRTWYGRVMVERIEGFCSTAEWERAYKEINQMEKELAAHGAVVIKFWMQIDRDEQERRFKERQEIPEKNWKITDEDWRNREKWDLYEQAVDEMLIRTSTPYAPWVIVEGNSKYYARIKVLETVVEAIEKALKK